MFLDKTALKQRWIDASCLLGNTHGMRDVEAVLLLNENCQPPC